MTVELICHSFLGLQLFPRWAAPQRILQREQLEPFALVSMGIIGLEAGYAAKDHPHDESRLSLAGGEAGVSLTEFGRASHHRGGGSFCSSRLGGRYFRGAEGSATMELISILHPDGEHLGRVIRFGSKI
jgi:hypothetical protein